MKEEQSKKSSRALDDAYWASLFEQEESLPLAALSTDDELPWPTTPVISNGRSHAETKTTNLWEAAQEVFEQDQVVQATVTDYNKGGLIVYWNNLQGFVPASQLIDFPQFHLDRERIKALQKWLHKGLDLKIIEINPATRRLIFSQRATMVQASQRDQLLRQIKIGQHLEGVVTNLTKFGAFVDLGGLEGLIHLSEISWGRVGHPSEILKPSQTLTVEVLAIEHEEGRVALSLKRLKPDPWLGVEERYQVGQLVEGTVSNITHFGAFVWLEDELEGLVHTSELAEGTFLHARNVVQIGEKVQARVLDVNGSQKRLALSLRASTREREETP